MIALLRRLQKIFILCILMWINHENHAFIFVVPGLMKLQQLAPMFNIFFHTSETFDHPIKKFALTLKLIWFCVKNTQV